MRRVCSAVARMRVRIPDRPRATVTVCYHHRHRRDCMVTERVASNDVVRVHAPCQRSYRHPRTQFQRRQSRCHRLHARCQRPYTRRLRPTPRCRPACHSVPCDIQKTERPLLFMNCRCCGLVLVGVCRRSSGGDRRHTAHRFSGARSQAIREGARVGAFDELVPVAHERLYGEARARRT